MIFCVYQERLSRQDAILRQAANLQVVNSDALLSFLSGQHDWKALWALGQANILLLINHEQNQWLTQDTTLLMIKQKCIMDFFICMITHLVKAILHFIREREWRPGWCIQSDPFSMVDFSYFLGGSDKKKKEMFLVDMINCFLKVSGRV